MKKIIGILSFCFMLFIATEGICGISPKYFSDLTSSSPSILVAINENLEIVQYNFTTKTWDSLISAQYSKDIGLDSERFTHSSLFFKDKLILCGYDGILIFSISDKESLVLKTETVNDFYKIFIGKDNRLIIVYRTGKVILIDPDSKIADIRKSFGV